MHIVSKNISRMRGAQILIEKEPRFEGGNQKFGSIFLPNNVNLSLRETKIGRVCRIAPGYPRPEGYDSFPMSDIKEGDLVYYVRYGPRRFRSDDHKDLVIIDEGGILARVDGEPSGPTPTVDEIQPRNDRLLCKPSYTWEEVKRSGLIVYHDRTKELVSVLDYKVIKSGGCGRRLPKTGTYVPNVVPVGSFVWANLLSGAAFTLFHGGQFHEYRLIAEGDILCYADQKKVS